MAKTSERRCSAYTRKGLRCRNRALLGSNYCHVHNYPRSMNYSTNKKSYSTKQNSGCFIATAVYSENSYQVNILKSFRDNHLMRFYLGRLFINIYYKLSPYTVNSIKKYSIISNFLKIILDIIVNSIEKRFS